VFGKFASGFQNVGSIVQTDTDHLSRQHHWRITKRLNSNISTSRTLRNRAPIGLCKESINAGHRKDGCAIRIGASTKSSNTDSISTVNRSQSHEPSVAFKVNWRCPFGE
jgi:hypothetical protein